ncbi:MAG TPA: endonuclease NucS domain-containing protein [Candidatus Acidoferrales bacterium]
MDIKESEMEDLIESHPEDFFPRKVLTRRGRQDTFQGIGRYDLLFEDQFKSIILMELKAVPAKLEVAEQLVRYQQALEEKGEKNIIMWLVAPLIPKHVAEFLDRFGVEHTEIHAAEFRQVASRYGYLFASDSIQKPPGTHTSQNNIRREQPSDGRTTGWSIASARKQVGSAEEFLGRCDDTGKTFFSTVFARQKSLQNKTKLTWKITKVAFPCNSILGV